MINMPPRLECMLQLDGYKYLPWTDDPDTFYFSHENA